jgi:hypothetical protein
MTVTVKMHDMEEISGSGQVFNKASKTLLGTVSYALAYRPPQAHRLGGFESAEIDLDWKTAMDAMNDGKPLTLHTSTGYVDFYVSRLSPNHVGVTMTGGFRDTL